MHPLDLITNAVQRRLSTMFPGYFENAKHDHNKDFGYPDEVGFEQTYRMFLRNGIARAGVEKTILKTWQDNPALWETEEADETSMEADIRQRFGDLRLWQQVAEADRRSLVGGYSGLILRLADSKRFQEPVDTVPGGLMGLVEVIPAWAGQLTVAEWDSDETSENYGQPLMFQFNEAQVAQDRTELNTKSRSFILHPDRVVIWSKDGTVHNRSLLEPGFNNLIDMEKISGAGGEGFWKNAKSAPVLEADQGLDLQAMAQGMGVPVEEIAEKMNEQVADWSKGFDAGLFTQGMKVKNLPVTLPQPEEFFSVALQGFAASIPIPLKILVGSQSGERASTEDANEWAQTNMARRTNTAKPNIMEMVNRLERFLILPERDWHLHWTDLTEASAGEKIDRAAKMAAINAAMPDEPVYSVGEIRMVTEHEGDGPDALEIEEDDE